MTLNVHSLAQVVLPAFVGALATLTISFDVTAAEHAATPADLAARVDTLFAEWDTTVKPGCAVAVSKDGNVVYKRGYGMANLEYDVPIGTQTIFHIASVSKQFTAAAIAMLILDGRIAAGDPIVRYIPEMAHFGNRITIGHLVHHTSGLRDQLSILERSGWRYYRDRITDDDVLSVLALQKQLKFEPGTRYDYSNSNYALMAIIVDRVSGKSLREFTAERIFEPLGMRDTRFRDDFGEVVKNFAYGYESEDDIFKTSVTNYDMVGATSLLTTVEDLMKWEENFDTGQLGGKPFIDLMLEETALNDGTKNDYAFGVVISKYKGVPIVAHSGADAGYVSYLIRIPQQHFSAAVLCNINRADPRQLGEQLAEIYLAKDLTFESKNEDAVPEKLVTLAAKQLSEKTGTYLNREKEWVKEIIFRDGKLYSRSDGQEYELAAHSNSRFSARKGNVQLTFADGMAAPQLIYKYFHYPADVYVRIETYRPTASDLMIYAGRYESEEIEAPYHMDIINGALQLRTIKIKCALRPVTSDFFSGEFGNVRFLRGPDGTVTGFLLGSPEEAPYHFVRQ